MVTVMSDRRGAGWVDTSAERRAALIAFGLSDLSAVLDPPGSAAGLPACGPRLQMS
jgi:hypothetical protein